MTIRITPLDGWTSRKIACESNLTAEALAAYQLEKLRQTLDLARRKSPFYQKHLQDAPSRITSLGDVAQFPFTTAEDIRAHALQFLCVSQDEIQRVVTLDTSGTTGQPKRLYFTREDQELTIDFFQVGMSTFTAPGDKVLILLPGERTGSVGDLLAIALQRLGGHPIKHGIVGDIAETLAVIQAEKVDGLVGIPAQVLALARYSPDVRLKSVLLSTDHVPGAVVRALEHTWSCQVYNHYGMTEMGLGGGVDCQARRGYHLREADLFFEIVEPLSGRPVAEGEAGEVVFTTLTRQGMPLIRYRTGDLSRFIPGVCSCGTRLKTLEWIRQRVGGAISIAGQGQLTLADLDEALFALDGIYDFSATFSHGTGGDRLDVQARAMLDTGPALIGAVEAALETIPAVRLARAADRLDVQIEILAGPPVPPPAGKRVLHISQ